MMRAGKRAVGVRGDLVPAVLVFAATLVIYILTLPPSLLPGDAGELVAASRTLGIGHPPGYPLYLMLGRIFSGLLAAGSIAYRYNMMSAVMASLAAAMLFLLIRALGGGRWTAAAAAAVIATGTAWWLQATGAEVYSMNALFISLLLAAALLGRRRDDRVYVLVAFTGGLAVSHHLTLLYPLVAALAVLLLGLKLRPRPGVIAMSALFFIVGLTVWLYVPIRSAQAPPLTWGETSTVKGFLSHITAQGYRWRLRPFNMADRLADFGSYIRLLFSQSGLWMSALALLGAAACIKRSPFVPALLLVFVLYGIHSAAYNIPDIEGHVFPVLVAVGVLAGLGAGFLADRLGAWSRRASYAVPAALALLLVVNVASIRRRQDEWLAHDYASAVIESAGARAADSAAGVPLIIGNGSPADYPVLYFSLIEDGGAEAFILGSSGFRHAGLPASPVGLDQCVEFALETRVPAEISLIGPAPPSVAGRDVTICGMVYVFDPKPDRCKAPAEFRIRGDMGDPRDYSSRLLAATYHLHDARWRLSAGDTAGAQGAIEAALKADPDDAGTCIYASRLLLEAGLPKEAFALANKAVEADPDFFEAHDMLASLYYMSGDPDRAIPEYEKALAGNPNPAPVYSNLGNAYSRKRDYGSAIRCYRMALSLDDAMVNAHIGLGIALGHSRDMAGAIRHLEKARSLEPESYVPYHSEAALLINTERYDEAFAAAREGLAAVPGSADLLSDIGLAFLRTGRPDSAAHYLELALAEEPELLSARGNLAVAYERLGEHERAAREYRIYLKTAPPGPARDRAAEALTRLTASPD
jgi:tetratricopeptide (TPR) repeat protein